MNKQLKKNPLGFWEINNKPTEQELKEYYADKYYQEAKGSYEMEYSDDELHYFNVKLEQRMAVIKGLISGNKKLLDIGCGEGYALSFFYKHGWSVRGIDFSSAGVEENNPDCLDFLLTGDIFKLVNDEISSGTVYDVILLQNVLEHVIDPIDLLHSLHHIVSPKGILIVTVPNDFSEVQSLALAQQCVDSEYWIAPPDHLNYFNCDSLLNTVNATNWECVEMLGDFPVDWFLFHPGSNYVRDTSLGKSSHKTRVLIENLIHENPISDVINFWSAAAKIGLGRDITVFLRSVKSS